MDKSIVRHDKLLPLVENVAVDDPFEALRLLQVCGVIRFGHIISSVLPDIIRPSSAARDAVVVCCLEAVHGYTVGPLSTHVQAAGAGGALLHSHEQHGGRCHLGILKSCGTPYCAFHSDGRFHFSESG